MRCCLRTPWPDSCSPLALTALYPRVLTAFITPGFPLRYLFGALIATTHLYHPRARQDQGCPIIALRTESMSGGFRARYPSQDRALLSRRLLLSSIFPSHRFWLVALCVGAGVKIFCVTLKSPHFLTPAHKIPQSTSRNTRALMYFRAIASLHWLYSMKSNRFPSDTTWRLQRSVFVALNPLINLSFLFLPFFYYS